MTKLTGKVAVINGGGSGIVLATAKRLVHEGAWSRTGAAASQTLRRPAGSNRVFSPIPLGFDPV